MKRLVMAAVLSAVLALGIGAIAFAADTTGNGAPSGAHYNLNIIGVENGKSPNMTGGEGHRIFVGLGKNGTATTRILLTEGDFAVLDANGTDGQAQFQLPNPDSDRDGTTSYSVFVRGLGKPGQNAVMQSCYEDATGYWCAVDFPGGVAPITISHTKGTKPTFTNVSKDLLYIDYCAAWSTTVVGQCDRVVQVPLFGGEADEYFWQYDNNGQRLAQLRFYEVPTVTGWTPPAQ